MEFLTTDCVTCSGLQSSILADFNSTIGKLQMRTLGLLGKLLTSPRMKTFYTPVESQVSHTDGIEIIRDVIKAAKKYAESPLDTLSTNIDFFGNVFMADETLYSLQKKPTNEQLFALQMKSCLDGIIVVLERQYCKYFTMDIDDELENDTRSARCHNMDSEEIMAMYSAAKSHAPNATLCYLSCTIRARKNNTVDYVDSLDAEKKEKLIKLSVTLGQKQHTIKRKKAVLMRAEISKRISAKIQKKQHCAEEKSRKTTESTKFRHDSGLWTFGTVYPV